MRPLVLTQLGESKTDINALKTIQKVQHEADKMSLNLQTKTGNSKYNGK